MSLQEDANEAKMAHTFGCVTSAVFWLAIPPKAQQISQVVFKISRGLFGFFEHAFLQAIMISTSGYLLVLLADYFLATGANLVTSHFEFFFTDIECLFVKFQGIWHS